MKHQISKTVVALAWYFPAQYEMMATISEDSEDLHHTYDQWLSNYGRVTAGLAESGRGFQRVTIDPQHWLQWCEKNKRPLNSDSRQAYISRTK